MQGKLMYKIVKASPLLGRWITLPKPFGCCSTFLPLPLVVYVGPHQPPQATHYMLHRLILDSTGATRSIQARCLPIHPLLPILLLWQSVMHTVVYIFASGRSVFVCVIYCKTGKLDLNLWLESELFHGGFKPRYKTPWIKSVHPAVEAQE